MDAANRNGVDVLVWGATGFTGKLVVQYLLENYSNQDQFTWGIGGRDKKKLDDIKKEFQDEFPNAAKIQTFIGNSLDKDSMETIVRNAKLVLTTVGPYQLYGTHLVAACAKFGVHYCDITGEPLWVRDMIDLYSSDTAASGAKIINFCGFDSVPFDLGSQLAGDKLREKTGATAVNIQSYLTDVQGSFSGGTLETLFRMISLPWKQLKRASDPYILAPESAKNGHDRTNSLSINYDPELKRWGCFSLMGGINGAVVRRSNELLGFKYGEEFTYSEKMAIVDGKFKSLLVALFVTSMVPIITLVTLFSPGRWFLRKLLPAPGEGPSKQERDNGYFTVRIVATSPESSEKAVVTVRGTSDPGYKSTAGMLAESGLCILKNPEINSAPGGFYTPSSLMGTKLVQRLKTVGMSFD